jgi:predicted NAD/FAD-binding protein
MRKVYGDSVMMDRLKRVTCKEYLDQNNYSEEFRKGWFLPLLSMVCTCSYESVYGYPMDIIVDYYMKNGTYNQHRSKHGSQNAVKHLSRFVEKVYLNCPVQEIWHGSATRKPFIKVELEKGKGVSSMEFDDIIVATQADSAIKHIKDLSFEKRNALKDITYEYTEMVVHEDPNLMPLNREDWSPINFIVSKNLGSVMCTGVINVEGRNAPLFQTWNPIFAPDPRRVLKRSILPRPVVSLRSVQAVAELDSMQGKDGVWFCGAYAMHAIPLQESAVRSAIRVFEGMGYACPW